MPPCLKLENAKKQNQQQTQTWAGKEPEIFFALQKWRLFFRGFIIKEKRPQPAISMTHDFEIGFLFGIISVVMFWVMVNKTIIK
jgi:ABC-type uncharacterized transport system permease subunit